MVVGVFSWWSVFSFMVVVFLKWSVVGVRPPFFAPVPLNTRQKLVSSRSTYLGEEESGLRSTYPSALMNHPSECDVSSGSSSYPEETWIQWFCNLTGNHFFSEIEKAYIEDSFNLYGLKQYLPKDYSKALDVILDRLAPNEAESEELSRSAALLYGLIHARYIITSVGLETMHRKYTSRKFGECPRMLCRGQAVLPMGFTDEPKQGMVHLFCAKCQDVYCCAAPQRHIDGAFFGPTFPALFFMTYENQVPEPAIEHFTPRVFGFKIHQSSSSLPCFRNVSNFRTLPSQRMHAFPPHSMLKILSPNDDDDDTKLVRISRPHTSEFPSRTLLSNSVVEKADFIPMEGAILERRNKRVFTTTIDHEDKLPDGDVGEGELNLSSLMPARYVGTEEATQEKKKAKTE